MSDIIIKEWKEQADDIFASQSQERRDYDGGRVQEICGMLEQLPTGSLIIQWIKENDIDIWLDYQCRNEAGGYHIPGSKTVCLSAHVQNIDLVPILAHETRHAWQDSHGLMPTMHSDAHTYLKQVRFIEADATAYEVQICYEMKKHGMDIKLNDFRSFCLKLQEKGTETLPDFMQGKDVLWSGFCGFFADRHIKNNYDSGSLAVGEILAGIKKGDSHRITTEYSANDYKNPERHGIDTANHDKFIILGGMFDGQNYLKEIPIKFLEDKQFIGNLSPMNSQRLVTLQAQEKPIKTYLKVPAMI